MVTMKKLAMVQDPMAARLTSGIAAANAAAAAVTTDAPPVPPPPENYRPQSLSTTKYTTNGAKSSGSGHVEHHHALDTLLEELQTTAIPTSTNNRLGVVENGTTNGM